jgi:hypothetical protein
MMEGEIITEPQRKLLFSQMAKGNVGKDGIENQLGFGISQLTKNEASSLIDCFIKNGDLAEVIKEIKQAREHPDKQTAPVMPSTKAKQEFHAGPVANNNTNAPIPAATERYKPIAQKASSKPELLAKMNNIPPELADMFFTILEGSLYIKQPGLLYMASKKGYARIDVSSEYDEETKGYKAVAKVYPIIPKEVIVALGNLSEKMQEKIINDYYGPIPGNGRAARDNVKMSTMMPFLRELAETRAINRALRLYTGYGGTSFEEMPQAEIREE